MSPLKPVFPSIPEATRKPFIDGLIELFKWQSGRIEQLEDKIKKLKQETRRPKFESSKMDENTDLEDKEATVNKKKKGSKRKKAQDL